METYLPTEEEFCVAAISENTNSFGLRGMVLMSEIGTTYQVGANSLHLKEIGDKITIPCEWNECDAEGIPQVSHNFYTLGYEIPTRLPNAPQNVIKEVWG